MKHVKCYKKDYPRPQLVRNEWKNLNGNWAFGFGEETQEGDALAGKLPRTINVPFSYETQLSGIGDKSMHKTVWYAARIGKKSNRRTLLHFEGADYQTTVYVNGVRVGSHCGAYTRFTFDLTDYLHAGENVLTVRCDDDNHPARVRGKQRWQSESFGCWYVQTTGIWKSVWLEYVSDTYLTALKITPDLSDYSVRFDAELNAPCEDAEICFEISFEGKRVQTAKMIAGDVSNSLCVALASEKLTYQHELWSPEHPALYDVTVTVLKNGAVCDEAGSYFGLREYKTAGDKILLNQRPFYARLLLDQGYWQESGLTPPSEEALARDIELAKQMGFNGVRKHQKTEDERYLYYADIMGFTVWCELPSNHWYSDSAAAAITEEWLAIVRQYYTTRAS